MTTTKPVIAALVAQFPITLDIRHNQDAILSIIARAQPDTLIVLPEGALSGYAEDPAFLQTIDTQMLTTALHDLRHDVVRQRVHLVFGSCVLEDGHWYNAGLYYEPRREHFVYRKVNLAISERAAFAAGAALDVVALHIAGHSINL